MEQEDEEQIDETEFDVVKKFMLEKYSHSPVMKQLMAIIFPWGETALSTHIENVAQKRKWEFFEELAREREITQKEIESDEFIHAFVATSDAAARTHRSEKRKLLARLLSRCGQSLPGNALQLDLYEEALAVIDRLNAIDLFVLLYFDQSSGDYVSVPNVPLVIEGANFSPNEILDRLHRLEALGLIRQKHASVVADIGSATGWNFTSLYYRLREILRSSSEANDAISHHD